MRNNLGSQINSLALHFEGERITKADITKADIREVVQDCLAGVNERLDSLEESVTNLRGDMNTGFSRLQEQIDSIEGKIDQINIRDIDESLSDESK